MLLDLTYRETEEGMHKLEKEREKIEEEQVQGRSQSNAQKQ